jgi:anti-sigma regulatory factor (Ser/Thr protein kinase)
LVSACIAIQEHTDAGEARRVAASLASDLSLDETSAGNVALVVTEAARNVLKHAGGGQIILRVLDSGGPVGIEMLALDKGPGIADLGRCFQDGYSTAGTAGTGLGAIARLSSVYEIYSRPDQGTVLMAQVWKRGPAGGGPVPTPRFCVGGVSIPVRGEEECGDGWIFQESARTVRLIVADGLGHGPLAADAARAAIRTAREQPNEPAPALLERIHGALRATGGAAVAVAEIDSPAQILRFAGVGNITAAIVPGSGPVRHLVSHAGTAGHEVRRISEFTSPWSSRSLLLMHSDGLQTRWSFDSYPGLLERHPSLIAGVLYRDYARGRDDVTVVLVREAISAC